MMNPYLWLFLSIWPAWIAAIALGFFIGWWLCSGRSAAAKAALRAGLHAAEQREGEALASEAKAKRALENRDRRIGELEKTTVAKTAVVEFRRRADEAEAKALEADKLRETAELKASRLTREMVPREELVAAGRKTAEAEAAAGELERKVGDLERQLRAAPKPRVVHDLAGFSHEEKASLELARGEIVKLEAEITRLQTLSEAHVDAARGATDRVKSEADRIRGERDAARAEVHAMLNQPKPAEQEEKTLPEDVAELQAKLAESCEARDRLRGALDAVTSELEALKGDGSAGPLDPRDHVKVVAERDSLKAQLARLQPPPSEEP